MDAALISAHGATIETDVNNCAQQNFGGEPATKTCIEGIKPDGTNTLSKACADCYDGAVACGASMCLTQCIGGSMSAGCMSCVAQKCTPAFNTCSGL
jgi:hypothetical protein